MNGSQYPVTYNEFQYTCLIFPVPLSGQNMLARSLNINAPVTLSKEGASPGTYMPD